MRKNSIKNTRINEEVRKELAFLIMNEVKDPGLHPMTSVTRVTVAPDLETCKVYISVLGDESALERTIQALTHAEGFLRRELAHTVNLRITPKLTFLPDTSIAYGVNMSHKIDEVIREDEAKAQEAAARAAAENPGDPEGPADDRS